MNHPKTKGIVTFYSQDNNWGKWAKFQIKFQAVLFAFGSIAVILAVVIGLS